MNVALLGFDTEGRASYEYFTSRGDTVTICDLNTEAAIIDGVDCVLGEDYLDNLDRFDLLVRTAGMKPSVILEKNPGVAHKITTLINIFLEISPTKNIIGVTGTKGKGTTSTLITNMLEAAGKTVRLGGNIGVPPLTFLSDLNEDSWVVLELSSFQLCDIKHSPHIAVCLMMAPEHLNWHPNMADYTLAKSRLFMHQSSDDIAIYFANNPISKEIAAAGAGQKLPYYTSPGAFVNGNMITIDGQEICTTDELKLLGAHNWQNVCAAITTVWQAGVRDIGAIRSVLTTFSGLEHRLELVRELDGVKYYDDSFGTTPETAIVAIQAFEQPKVVILGGSDKGANFDELAKVVANANVRKVILIGNTTHPEYRAVAPDVEAALRAQGFDNIVSLARTGGGTMAEAVQAARENAQPGDVVLLSVGSASFDMFQNYKDRGNQFKSVVSNLS